jgi:hypothetical protein
VVHWFAATSSKRGRSPTFPDAAIQFCLTIKNQFGLALRQATGLVQSLLSLSGLHWPVPGDITLCRVTTGPERTSALTEQRVFSQKMLVNLVNLVSLLRVFQRLCTHLKEATASVSSHLYWQFLSYQSSFQLLSS